MTVRDLFGGAITADTPGDLLDASDVRQVPDNQEVFSYPDSSISIIVEVLERVEFSDPYDAIRFHFDALAHDNSASSATIERMAVSHNNRDGSDCTPSATVLNGVQEVSKFNRSTPDRVQIYMALFRVDWKNADLVVTFNVPTSTTEGDGVTQEQLEAARADFDTFILSLTIVDDGLFA